MIVRVSSTGRTYGCPLRAVRIDRTYGQDVRAQKNDARTYGRSLRPVRTGSVYRPLLSKHKQLYFNRQSPIASPTVGLLF